MLNKSPLVLTAPLLVFQHLTLFFPQLLCCSLLSLNVYSIWLIHSVSPPPSRSVYSSSSPLSSHSTLLFSFLFNFHLLLSSICPSSFTQDVFYSSSCSLSFLPLIPPSICSPCFLGSLPCLLSHCSVPAFSSFLSYSSHLFTELWSVPLAPFFPPNNPSSPLLISFHPSTCLLPYFLLCSFILISSVDLFLHSLRQPPTVHSHSHSSLFYSLLLVLTRRIKYVLHDFLCLLPSATFWLFYPLVPIFLHPSFNSLPPFLSHILLFSCSVLPPTSILFSGLEVRVWLI